MTAAFLQSELSSLISDSKRKHPDVRTAADKSLSELKSISVTSETQLAGDLLRRPYFAEPFILACQTQNAKLASIGAAGLQRLVASTALARSRLLDVLQAFELATVLGLDVQLKILQTLPSLLQLYAADLHGETLARILSVSADLSASKLPMVSSTASATFQQLVSAVFTRSSQIKNIPDHSSSDGEDAWAIFVDLCGLLAGNEPRFVRLDKLPPASILETTEGLLSLHGRAILQDEDCLTACKDSMLPGLLTLIESSTNYGIVVRALRIVFLLTTRYGPVLSTSLSEVLDLAHTIVDKSSNHKWKRILGLEFARGLFSDFDALRFVFSTFDSTSDQKNIVTATLSALVRITSEDPSLIGLGRQTTIPMRRSSQSLVSAADTGEVPIGTASAVDDNPAGISQELSTVNTPCLDMYDRINPPDVPDTYLHSLVLGCMAAFTDGLSKTVMPLSVPARKPSKVDHTSQVEQTEQESAAAKHQTLFNPLKSSDITRQKVAEQCAELIEACWPAILAMCSTFLNAALDSYFYHMLIRTVQKLAQVSGVLELDTPRDALLTTLAKVSVPNNASGLINTYYTTRPAIQQQHDRLSEDDDNSVTFPIPSTPRKSIDTSPQSLNIRNLLCLRALLNLGIALGPTLSKAAWTIILQSLQQVEALMTIGPNAKAFFASSNSKDSDSGSANTLASEISAVDTARRRMMDGTQAYSNQSLQLLCDSIFALITELLPSISTMPSNVDQNGSLRPKTLSHKSTRSVSGAWIKSPLLEIEVQFVLKVVGRVASVNLYRFRQTESIATCWSLVVSNLLALQQNHRLQPQIQLQAANIIDALVVEACSNPSDQQDNSAKKSLLLQNGLPTLQQQVENIVTRHNTDQILLEHESRMLVNVLEALQNLIGAQGDRFDEEWDGIFVILSKVCNDQSSSPAQAIVISSAFKTTQLIASDFLTSLQPSAVQLLLHMFRIFGAQQVDLNMALITTALYWNVASLLVQQSSFTDNSDGLPGNDDEPSVKRDLRQQLLQNLAEASLDDRSDVRDASAKILIKTLDLYLDNQTAGAAGLYTDTVLILLAQYADRCGSEQTFWQISVQSLLSDATDLFTKYPTIITSEQDFSKVWTSIRATVTSLLQIKDITISTKVFHALCQYIETSSQFKQASRSTRPEIKHLWELWFSSQPAEIYLAALNEAVIQAHLRVWQKLVEWDDQILQDGDQFSKTASVLTVALQASRHDNYTTDLTSPTPEQKLVLDIVRTLRLSDKDRTNAVSTLLLQLVRSMISRCQSISSAPKETKVKVPSGIAFSTQCLDMLQSILDDFKESAAVWRALPLHDIIDLSTLLVRTKYSSIPTNTKQPLWRSATTLGLSCACLANKHYRSHDASLQSTTTKTNDLLQAILDTPHLTESNASSKLIADRLLEDEMFDKDQLHRLNATVYVYDAAHIDRDTIRTYITTTFKHSLAAKSWHNDACGRAGKHSAFDLKAALASRRRGTIREPEIPYRATMYQQCLSNLFDLVNSERSAVPRADSSLARLAAPYVLIRVAHTLKTFIVDQPLRFLEPPHPKLQQELYEVLQGYVGLKVIDQAFDESVDGLSKKDNNGKAVRASLTSHDGRTHLRLLYGLMLQFEKAWNDAPRLKKEYAWQNDDHGAGIELCLKAWKESVGEHWGVIY